MPANHPDDNSPVTRTVILGGIDPAGLFGVQDEQLRTLESNFPDLTFFARGDRVTLTGPRESVNRAEEILDGMRAIASQRGTVTTADTKQLLKPDTSGSRSSYAAGAHHMLSAPIVSSRGSEVRPQTAGQRSYVDAITNHTITFGVGPAGTGKTFLAMAKAVQALQQREVSRIVLTRPAVEAGERLGYLPGSLEEKIDPYLRPLFDAIATLTEPEAVQQLLANGTVEVAPLAYMRGRTLNDAFVILDEAQNTTPEQMKMFLTRLGFGSKMVVTGDITQIDLPHSSSGLKQALHVLKDVEDLSIVRLSSDDIVRHSLVGRIVDAYDDFHTKTTKDPA